MLIVELTEQLVESLPLFFLFKVESFTAEYKEARYSNVWKYEDEDSMESAGLPAQYDH